MKSFFVVFLQNDLRLISDLSRGNSPSWFSFPLGHTQESQVLMQYESKGFTQQLLWTEEGPLHPISLTSLCFPLPDKA